MLARSKKYSEANPDKIVAMGDTHQLECVDLISENLNYDGYMNIASTASFPTTSA